MTSHTHVHEASHTYMYIHDVHTYIIHVHDYIQFITFFIRALSDFDGDFLPDLGTQHPPAEICPDNSSLSPIALKIGLKVAGPVRIMRPHLLSLCTCDLDLNSNYPGKSPQGNYFGPKF